jgi:hypothetical protein
LKDLFCQVEAEAANEPDALALLVALIKVVVRTDVDPYLLNGVPIEAIAATVNSRFPDRRRRQVAIEAVRLLLDRLQASGAT